MIFVRNVRTPDLTATWSAHAATMLIRELLLLADWTDQSITTGPIGPSADAAWATCLVLAATSPNGVQVAAANPREIYDPLARFTAAMVNQIITLKGTLNKGMFKIVEYVDTSHVKIDVQTAPPLGWTDESDIPARVVNVTLARLAAGAQFLSQAPSSNLQLRVQQPTTSTCYCYARPRGGAGVATEANAAMDTGIANGTDTYLRFNAVLDGPNAAIFFTSAYGWRFVMCGELTDTDTGDNDPGFLWWAWNSSYHITNMTAGSSLWMLNHLDARLQAYTTFPKAFTGTDVASMFYNSQLRRLQDGRPGRLHLRRPKVVGADSAGTACVRGKLPLIRVCVLGLEIYRPIDAAGNWIHMRAGLVLPRNGPNDPLPITGG